MKIIWNDARKKCNITDSSFEDIIENSNTTLTQDDKDFILTSFNAGMYNYVVEYVFNKTVKILQDVIFSIGEEIVINITHWIDKTFISKFFDVFILRLATDFDLISRQEKLKILQTIELLQRRKDNNSNNQEIDKERAKYLIANCFDAVLLKDFEPFTTSVKDTIEALFTVEILPYSDIYNDIIESTNKHKNLLIRIMFALLKNADEKDGKRFKTLCQNVKNLFPFLWDNASMNDKKFISFYLKTSSPDAPINRVFNEISTQIKLQDFNTDLVTVTKILKSCQDVLSCHYSVSNHKGEIAPLIQLSEVESFPNLFLRSVITPCLIAYLGNNNGYFNESRLTAEDIFEKITPEKWTYYFKNYFYRDDFVLINLITVESCLKDWCTLVKKCGVDEDEMTNENIKELILVSKKHDYEKVVEYANKIYYS
ncbi:MAG: hypothetical protein IKI95_04845 [Clostridia bacterium]|nr:hypothetical protein [Clostridia bacterium]